MQRIIRLSPDEYVHVLDSNSNITRVSLGPATFTRKDHEALILGPEKLVAVPSGSYCIVASPVKRTADGNIVLDKHGQAQLKHGVREVRLAQEPFPLYPGEALVGAVEPLEVVAPNEALHLRALNDFSAELEDGTVVPRRAGDEWLFEGPGTFIPSSDVRRVSRVTSTVLMPNQALRIRARREFTDRSGVARLTGQEWLVRESELVEAAARSAGGAKARRSGGAYIAAVEEEVLGVVHAHVLTDKRAVRLKARVSFVDAYGVRRLAGQARNLRITASRVTTCRIPASRTTASHLTASAGVAGHVRADELSHPRRRGGARVRGRRDNPHQPPVLRRAGPCGHLVRAAAGQAGGARARPSASTLGSP